MYILLRSITILAVKEFLDLINPKISDIFTTQNEGENIETSINNVKITDSCKVQHPRVTGPASLPGE